MTLKTHQNHPQRGAGGAPGGPGGGPGGPGGAPGAPVLVSFGFPWFFRAEGTKIAGFSPMIALESPLGGQEDCGKGPSCMGEGGVLPPSTAPCPKRVKRRVLIRYGGGGVGAFTLGL